MGSLWRQSVFSQRYQALQTLAVTYSYSIVTQLLQCSHYSSLLRVIPSRWRRSHNDFLLIPSWEASSVSLIVFWFSRTNWVKYCSKVILGKPFDSGLLVSVRSDALFVGCEQWLISSSLEIEPSLVVAAARLRLFCNSRILPFHDSCFRVDTASLVKLKVLPTRCCNRLRWALAIFSISPSRSRSGGKWICSSLSR